MSCTRVDDDRLLIVASDRVSVFDVVLPDDIPDKGRVLTGDLRVLVRCHRRSRREPRALVRPRRLPARAPARGRGPGDARAPHPAGADGVHRPRVTSSAGRGTSTAERGTVQGRVLPAGLREADPLPEPLFTPTTKADEGHDLPISDAEAVALVGEETFEAVKVGTLAVYERGARLAAERGVILADTKLEWGHATPSLLVIDEMLTPDSSRYWPAEDYGPGRSPPSFDKQYVRDHYLEIGWDKTTSGAAPAARGDRGTRARYVEAYERSDRPQPRRLVRIESEAMWSERTPYRARSHRRASAATEMAMFARVEITHLPGIADPQGATVERALPALGYTNVSQVHVGKSIRLVVDAADADAARAQVLEMCDRLLANPVIEAYEVEITALAGVPGVTERSESCSSRARTASSTSSARS